MSSALAIAVLPAIPSNAGSREIGVSDDAELVRAAQHGDGDAFGELVRRHERRVFALASRFSRRRPDVEDAAQETFLRAWTKLASYRAEAPFEHWLTRLCLNVCIERARRKRPREDELPDDLAAPESGEHGSYAGERKPETEVADVGETSVRRFENDGHRPPPCQKWA